MSEQKKPQMLGRILLQRKLITQTDLDQALGAKDQVGKPLASRLIDRGVLSELDAVRALSEQHGVPGIDLSQVAIDVEHLILPREVAEAHKLLPVLVKDDKLFVAMADPGDKKAIDELEFVTGKKVYPYVALASPLLRSIVAAYDAKQQGERHYLAPKVPHETLVRLGLTGSHDADGQPGPKPSEPPPPIVDEETQRSAEEVEVTTDAFGRIGSDISSVSQLPTDLREQVGQTPQGGGSLVLIVDDETEIRKLVRKLLEGKGHRVIEADRGLLALRMVKEHVPDLIILDAMLPELHGFDIARRIKGSQMYGKIPIVMISAVYRGWRIAQDLKENYGIEEYLEKPFRIADVLAVVQRALAKTTPSIAPPAEANADAEAALKAGIEAYQAGRIDDAIAHLQRGVGIDPLAFRLRFHLGLLYGKKGAMYEGMQELEKAVELNPKSFPALKNLAVLYEKAGFRNKAVEVWERAASAAPDSETREQIKQHLLGLL
ncbi:MAG TPA: response regulator [Polyangiaceae bacterium]|jgi:CheY-like chemotaxis protein|nr:response regulator [Polyangiaceae bacterium]